jgi:hypothetical protein
MPIGIESAHGFGDLCFNLSLIRELKKKYNDEVWVAARTHCKDALYNTPWISKIIDIKQMNQGIHELKRLNCKPVFQITQNIKFFEFRQHDPNHSLIDTPLLTGHQLGIDNFDQRPIFIPTEQELSVADEIQDERPIIAIESVYTSAQSWAKPNHFTQILEHFGDTHRVLWLSNEGCPVGKAKHHTVDNMLRYTRRQCIMALSKCKYFFSVGSGFFCASLALPKKHQPKNTICLWTDNLYRYEKRLSEVKWNNQITWVHNPAELSDVLGFIKCNKS